MDESMSSATQWLIGAVDRCTNTLGFEYPLYLCMVSANGCITAVRYPEPGVPGEPLAQTHDETDKVLPPLNLMVTDSQGKGARFSIDRDNLLQIVPS
jgi:hypothetical protein